MRCSYPRKRRDEMKQPHKHAELIKAWADGAEIEYFNGYQWEKWSVNASPSWYENNEYRIKPEPKPDVVRYMAISAPKTDYVETFVPSLCPSRATNLRLIFDGETGKLKNAEVLE